MLRAQTVDDVLLLESLLQQIDVLRLVGIVEFLPRLEAGRIAGFKADKLVAVVVQAYRGWAYGFRYSPKWHSPAPR